MPNGRGGNLTQPLKKVLINVPGPDNLGTFLEASSNDQILQFKQHGYSIPANGNETVRVSLPQPHTHRVSLFQISDVAPFDPLNYEYGITISSRVRKPGVHNSKFFPEQKHYGGKLPFVTTPVIADAELNEMRDSIIRQINDDSGYTQRPEYQMPGAAVVASNVLHLDTWNAASAITLDAEAAAAAATIEEFVDNINDIPGYFAWLNPAEPATEIFVIKTTRDVDPDDDIAFVQTAGNIDVAAAQPVGWIALTNRYEDATFQVKSKESFGVNTIVRNGNFAFLTNDEVQQIFSHIPNDGMLAQERRHPNLVLPGVDYAKINIDVAQQHYDLGGASHGLIFINAIELYVPVAELAAGAPDRWEAIAANRVMDAGAVNNFRDVMNQWSAGSIA